MNTQSLAADLAIIPRAFEDETDWDVVKQNVQDFCDWGLTHEGLIEPPNRWFPKYPLKVRLTSDGRERLQPAHQPGCAPSPSQLKAAGGMHSTAPKAREKNVLAIVRIHDEAQESDLCLVLTFLLHIEEYSNDSVEAL